MKVQVVTTGESAAELTGRLSHRSDRRNSGPGGAEKQLVYMVRALCDAGVDLRVYSLTMGEFYEARLGS